MITTLLMYATELLYAEICGAHLALEEERAVAASSNNAAHRVHDAVVDDSAVNIGKQHQTIGV